MLREEILRFHDECGRRFSGPAGRTRSSVRVTPPLETRRELRRFAAVRHARVTDTRWPRVLDVVAGYQHFTANRPR